MHSESLSFLSAHWPAFFHLLERGILSLLEAREDSQYHTLPLLGATFSNC